MRQKIFLLTALLCAVAQGAWAADRNYEYPTKTKPSFYSSYGEKSNVVVINTEAELAYITANFSDGSGYNDNKKWYELDYYLNADLDMGENISWLPMGRESYMVMEYRGTFWGNGHTIRYRIWDLDEENQALFSTIYYKGKVYDVNVICNINTKRDYVGGIAGENHGLIQNCTVTANIIEDGNDYVGGIVGENCSDGTVTGCRVEGRIEGVGSATMIGGIAGLNIGAYSNIYGNITNCRVSADIISGSDSKNVGGIVGSNEGHVQYCCMTGNLSYRQDNKRVGGLIGDNSRDYQNYGDDPGGGQSFHSYVAHCTFYGMLNDSHNSGQEKNYIGEGWYESCYDTFDQSEYDNAKANGHDLYAYAIKYPYAINVTTVGQGSVTVSAGGEDNIPGARHQQEVTLTTPSGLNADVTVTDADGNNVNLFGNSSASGYTFFMRRPYVNVHVIFSVPNWPRQGSGTADSPYLITSADDWNEFALSVNAGNNHSGRYVKLTKDINIWMMAGASVDCSFQGTFDGDGHTMNFNPTNTNAVTAPFRFTKNATIKNLRTAGSITTDAMNAAGIVGDVTGSVNLTNCSSSVTISSSRADADYHGGLVASNKGSVTISGCVFDGSFVATVAHTNQYGTTFCGGLVGYCGENTSTTITNSLVAPTSVSEGMVSNTFVGYSDGSSTLNITNSYFVATTNLPGNEGTQAVAAATATANLGDLVQDYSMVKAYQNGIFYDGTYYMVPAALSGSGTELAPYTISSLYEWNSFAYHVNNGTTFSGKTVKLTDNISVETMAGVWSDTQSERRVFSGTFDGDGHTLTINVSNQGRFAAPFKCVSDATIKNLRTAGTIDGTGNSDGKLLAGIIGVSFGNTTITGCRSSVTLTTDFGEDAALAGIVAGTKGGSLTIEGCVFDGSMTGASNTRCAGIAGYDYPECGGTNTTISDCLFIPATLTISTADDSYTKTFSRDPDATITNCYYTQTLGATQGTVAVASTAPTDLSNLVEDYGMVKAYAHGILVGGTYYGVSAGNVSLADDDDNSTKISNANGYVADVTLSGRTLYKDGAWNTLCLPFSVDNFTGTPLEGATVKTLASTGFSGGTLTMTFTDDVTTIEAGKPYIVKWANGTDIANPVFNGVTISDAPANAETDYADFMGTYSPVSIYTDEKTNLYLGAGNTLYYPTEPNFQVNAFRGYFQLKQGLKAGDSADPNAGVRAFVLNFGDDEATGIISVHGSGSMVSGADAWYTLDGCRLSAKPTRAGVYINNGNMVVIK